MKSNKQLFLAILSLLFFTINVKAQTKEEFTKLLCKDWKVNYYELNGTKLDVSEGQRDAKIVYRTNNTMTMSQVTVVRNGKWSYDEQAKIMTVDYISPESQDVFHIIKINENELIMEIDDMNRGKIRFNFLTADKP